MNEAQAERIIKLLGIIATKVGAFGPSYDKKIAELVKGEQK